MKYLVLVFIFFSALKTVYLQEFTESSGEVLTSVSNTFISESSSSEAISSGEGPIVTVLDDTDLLTESLSNNTDYNDSAIFNNGEVQLSNETTTQSIVTTTFVDVTEITTPSATETTMQTTTSQSTTTTIKLPSTTPEITETPSTTTVKTTTTPTTTTTKSTTTTTTTTKATTTTQKIATTMKPKTTTGSQPSDNEPDMESPGSPAGTPCEFTDKELVCDVELICFGEGTVDCSIIEEDLQEIVEIKPSPKPSVEEAEDYEDDESATVGFFPSELVGKVPPRFSFPWHIKSMDTDPLNEYSSSGSSSTTSTTAKATSETTSSASSTSSTGITLSSSAGTSASSSAFSSASSSASSLASSSSSVFVNNTDALIHYPLSSSNASTYSDNSTDESMELASPSSITSMEVDASKLTEVHPLSTLPSQKTITESVNTSQNDELVNANTTPVLLRRKRDSNKVKPASSSESLKLTVDDSKQRGKHCKITGNLQCNPLPMISYCQGKGTCKVISVEKTEKSTSSKGMETWAFVVIAICATAAALTIGLLTYLVVTSWKKLKVQPQNGVTTLNYVNSTPP